MQLLISKMLGSAIILAGLATAAVVDQDVFAASPTAVDQLSTRSRVNAATYSSFDESGILEKYQEAQDLKRRDANPQQIAPTTISTSTASASASSRGSTTASAGSSVMASSTAPGTSIAVFTAGGGVYTATAVSSIVLIAGYQLHVGGDGALVGGVRVSDASNGFIAGGTTFSYTRVTAATSTSLAPASTTVGGSASSGSASAGSSSSAPSTTGSATAASGSATSSSTHGAAVMQTPGPIQALALLGGIAMILA